MQIVANAESVQLQSKMFRGFGDPARLNILQVLRNGPIAVYFGFQLNPRRTLDLAGDRRHHRSLDWDQVVRIEVDSVSSCPLANSTWRPPWKSTSPKRASENTPEFTGCGLKVR